MDAAVIAGLLAERERRRVAAAMILGATTLPELVDRTGLELREVVDALARLRDGGLVVEGDQRWFLLEEAFGAAARAAASSPAPAEVGDLPADQVRVLRTFVRDGRLLSIPSSWAKRRVVLDLLAQDFEPGERYPEEVVNLVLGRWHPDTAALRRHLVDEGFLDRAAGFYWRSGGTVPLDADADDASS